MSVADRLRELRPDAVPGSLFDRVGGRPTLDRVHKVFYDKAYEHDWMKNFFLGVEQEAIESAQSDFMTQAMKGGKIFCGRPPGLAHVHVEVSEELFDLRHQMLAESLDESEVRPDHRSEWLAIDYAFKSVILRELRDCRPRSGTISTRPGDILSVPKPPGMDQARRAA